MQAIVQEKKMQRIAGKCDGWSTVATSNREQLKVKDYIFEFNQFEALKL